MLTEIGEIFDHVLFFINTFPESVSVPGSVSMYCLYRDVKQEIVCFKGELCNQMTAAVLQWKVYT